ncbi:arsenite methyltransferase-like [Physella acuta]|uniref:arsenite methyltransferase-like n=1 Tax=Physella acuta TaxID=109671 RepID=UPI0027DE432F|nr:arsenite methyltransferase-like [Physella acuta]XP_059142582.1 arsenite methyltransferase-like [Physella acuta]
MNEETSQQIVKQMYKTLIESLTLDTRLNIEAVPSYAIEILSKISPRSRKTYDGSAIFIPDAIEGARVLDIGCGGGSLSFVLSKLVGPAGYVVGVDFSEDFIQLCQEETAYHMKEWGYSKPNCEFICSDVEKLLDFQLEPFDVIVSNGLMCLVHNKGKVIQIISRLLKEGGEFYNSDIFSDTKQCEEVKATPLFCCYGLSGAMVWSDLKELTGPYGFSDPYLLYAADTFQFGTEKNKLDLRGVSYVCAVYRLIKLVPESTGQGAIVSYNGNYEKSQDFLKWDVDTIFKKDVPIKIDGYFASLLAKTKFARFFTFEKYEGQLISKRNQNPFSYLKELRESGSAYPKPIFPMDEEHNKYYEDAIKSVI